MAVAPSTIRVAIIEDRKEIREGLAMIINATHGFRSSAIYGTMAEGLDGIAKNIPDVVLNDIQLPGISGIEGIRILRDRHPEVVILILTIYDDEDRIFDALCAGASGYLLKKTPPAHWLESIRQAVTAGGPLSPAVAGRVVERSRHAVT